MEINIVSCLFVLESESSDNIRKNDNKKIKVLVNKDKTLPKFNYLGKDEMKEELKNNLSRIVGSDLFHLEQVFTLSDPKYCDKKIDVIYLGVTNSNFINISEDYELISFDVLENTNIYFGNNTYTYKTKEVFNNSNIDYIHEIDVRDKCLEKTLLELLIAYKRLRTKVDNSDIIFKFMDKYFTLEDVRIVYEMIKDVKVDKSNFRKRIVKYVLKVDEVVDNKGHRPTQLYSFKPLKGDIWL